VLFFYSTVSAKVMSDARERAVRALHRNDSVMSQSDDRYVVTSTTFDAELQVQTDDSHLVFDIELKIPMLDAATKQDVPEVVENGWLDTFSLRMEDAASATRGQDALTIETTQDEDVAVVRAEIKDIDAKRAVDDCVSVVEYAEGTYVEGIIPGYDYTGIVGGLVEKATETGGGTSGGPPL
jgi:hypothetical protein